MPNIVFFFPKTTGRLGTLSNLDDDRKCSHEVGNFCACQ